MATNRLPDSFDIVEAIRLLDERLSRLEALAERPAPEPKPEPTQPRIRRIQTKEQSL